MATFCIAKEPIYRRHRAAFFSRACWFNMGVYVVYVLVPFVLAYATPGFWVKEVLYREQPSTSYNHKALLWTNSGEWSSSSFLNQRISASQLLQVDFEVASVDTNADGLVDYYDVSASIPQYGTTSTAGVTSIGGVLSFQLTTSNLVSLNMEALTTFNLVGGGQPVAGSGASIDANLELQQVNPILQGFGRSVYSSSVLDLSGTTGMVDIGSVLQTYYSRNETTILRENWSKWEYGKSENFLLHMRIRVPKMLIGYRPAFWELMKYAWIQYLAVLTIVYVLVRWLRNWIIHNQILPTRLSWDYVPAKRD